MTEIQQAIVDLPDLNSEFAQEYINTMMEELIRLADRAGLDETVELLSSTRSLLSHNSS